MSTKNMEMPITPTIENKDSEREISPSIPVVPKKGISKKALIAIAITGVLLLAVLVWFFLPKVIGKPRIYPAPSASVDICKDIEARLPQLIAKGNYCDTNSDCVLEDFGCPLDNRFNFTNIKYEGAEEARKLAEEYRQKCPPCYYDTVAPKENEIACQQNKCVDLRDATINKLPSSTNNPSPVPVTDKYDIDTDGDSIPDFVETATGFDPTKDECLLAACEGYNANDQPATKTNVMFILDSSGSMAGVSGASRKIDAAKNALKRYIAQAKTDTTAGLMVYGHKGSNYEKDKAYSCSQIEVLYPLGAMDKEKFTTAVDSFQPVGWTPIGNSLRLAGKSLDGTSKDDKNIILLVSDGVETCDTDPLGAAKELQTMGLKIQIDVIGFDLEPAAKEQLQKVAEIGGGKFYNAQTSEEFDKVMIDWFKESQNSQAAFNCKTASSVSFMSCIANRSVAIQSYFTYLQGSVLQNYVEVYGVTAVKGEDTNEKINEARRRYSDYRTRAGKLFSNQNKEAWEEWQANYEKLKSGR